MYRHNPKPNSYCQVPTTIPRHIRADAKRSVELIYSPANVLAILWFVSAVCLVPFVWFSNQYGHAFQAFCGALGLVFCVMVMSLWNVSTARPWRVGTGYIATMSCLTLSAGFGGALVLQDILFELSDGQSSNVALLVLGMALSLAVGVGVAWMTQWLQRRYDRALLTHGQVVRGVVESARYKSSNDIDGRAWFWFALKFRDVYGHEHRKRMCILDTQASGLSSFKPGQEVTVLSDPQTPRSFVVPAWLDVAFKEISVPDTRGEHVAAETFALADDVLALEGGVHMLATLRPVPVPKLLGWVRGRKDSVVGELTWHDETLCLVQDDTQTNIDMLSPFAVQLSVWPLDAETAELHVVVRQRDALVESPAIAFKTEWPQAALTSNLPVQQRHLPCLSPEDFAIVWPVILRGLAAHGELPCSVARR